jgi:hypothetical protein
MERMHEVPGQLIRRPVQKSNDRERRLLCPGVTRASERKKSRKERSPLHDAITSQGDSQDGAARVAPPCDLIKD